MMMRANLAKVLLVSVLSSSFMSGCETINSLASLPEVQTAKTAIEKQLATLKAQGNNALAATTDSTTAQAQVAQGDSPCGQRPEGKQPPPVDDNSQASADSQNSNAVETTTDSNVGSLTLMSLRQGGQMGQGGQRPEGGQMEQGQGGQRPQGNQMGQGQGRQRPQGMQPPPRMAQNGQQGSPCGRPPRDLANNVGGEKPAPATSTTPVQANS